MRFANSLRLRLAIRIAMADPDKARDEAHKSLTHPAGLLEEAYEVVAVSTAGTGYSNPLGEINKAWGEVFMNANMESILRDIKTLGYLVILSLLPDRDIPGSTGESGKGQDLIIPAIVSIREARLPRKRTLS